jgi:hypothetical protein
MRKATYEMLNLHIDRLEYIKDMLESKVAQEKITEEVTGMRAILNEEFLMGSTNRRTCKTMRTNFVKNNPGLLDAAQKIIEQPLSVPMKISDLFDNKYLRVVITFVKDKVPDLRYFTYEVGDDRMLVKVTGTIPEDAGEHFDPQF